MRKKAICDVELIKDYQSGLTSIEVASKHGISPPTVRDRLRKRGVKIRPKESYHLRKTKFNYAYFDVIDTSEKAYWLGFLHADGYNNQERGSLSVGLSSKDKSVLERLRRAMTSDNKISEWDRKNRPGLKTVAMTFTNEHFSKRLAELGCFQRKSLKNQLPSESQVPSSLIWHFIRGFFDGDGSVKVKGRNANIVGGRKFIKELVHFLGQHGIIAYSYQHAYNNKVYYCTINSIYYIIKFAVNMYQDSEGCRLERKHERFMEIQQYFVDRYKAFTQLMINVGLLKGEEKSVDNPETIFTSASQFVRLKVS